MARVGLHVLVAACCLATGWSAGAEETKPGSSYAEIRVVDEATGRGVPLVELETVNSLKFVTDNAGRVAFNEPGLMDREIFFSVKSHGYEVKKDGFGMAGVRIVPAAGKASEIKIARKNLAERLCRLTGEGLYRDTILLGHPVPLAESASPGLVAGQDSIQATIYRGKIYWLWGDTQQMKYPLGLFRMAGATTPILDAKTDLTAGIAYEYFVDPKTRFARAMMPLADRPEGVVWISAVFVVPDQAGKEKLVGHYSRRKGLGDELEQGIAIYNDEKQIFESAKELPLTETWRRPNGHPIFWEEGGKRWLLFGSPSPNVRVPATLADVVDAAKYEAYTCAKGEGPIDSAWRWQKELLPVDSETEAKWVKSGKLKAEQARYYPADASAPQERVTLHRGTVRWNAHRQKWILIAGQIYGRASFLGEVWYSEADSPLGPFPRAVKIITHDRQTFYNVCHHDFLDREGGRFVHLEGTYTNDFSNNPERTPRYNYNQVLYRLDLDAAGLKVGQGLP